MLVHEAVGDWTPHERAQIGEAGGLEQQAQRGNLIDPEHRAVWGELAVVVQDRPRDEPGSVTPLAHQIALLPARVLQQVCKGRDTHGRLVKRTRASQLQALGGHEGLTRRECPQALREPGGEPHPAFLQGGLERAPELAA